jgi:AbrB family looped-hinge helix DNA binding protein
MIKRSQVTGSTKVNGVHKTKQEIRMTKDSAFYGAATVGAKGQIVIPPNARHAMQISPGDKVVVVRGPRPRSITIYRADSIQKLLETANQEDQSAAA